MIAFDKDTCSDFETALSKEWLETNGLGGFASSTINSCNTRRYHGLLVAATQPPAGRLMLVNAFEEWVDIDGVRQDLSSHQFPDAVYPKGHENLIGFRLDPWPIWTYRLGPIILEKTLAMIHGQNTTIVTYKVRKGVSGARLQVRPYCTGRGFHGLHRENADLDGLPQSRDGVVRLMPYLGVPALFIHHNGRFYPALNWVRGLTYAQERERGLEAAEDCWTPGDFQFTLEEGAEAVVILTTEGAGYFDAGVLLREERARRRRLLEGWESSDDVTHHLVLAADQFVVSAGRKAAKDKEELFSLIAGYPWFEEWGRDTFICLPGLLLVTGRFAEARSILHSYARWIDQGMIPNRFPDEGGAPDYQTVDAGLWFIVAVFHYLRYTKDFDFVRDHLWSGMQEIVRSYQNGTRFQIHMDLDGLLHAGQPGMALTWMDARSTQTPVTPRIGKPVEIQALWYNSLRMCEQIGQRLGDKDSSRKWAGLAEKVWASFNKQFWYEEGGYLYDVVNGSVKDATLRPNQILAVSLPFETCSPERALRIVQVLEDRLLTPFGLRTLDPGDPAYKGRYAGTPAERDRAYHQGTAWPWLIGPFLTAFQKVQGKSPKVQAALRAHLALLLTHLWEAGLGTVSEIFDGDMPHDPRGCIAQAWSVAEILRVLREDLAGASAPNPAPSTSASAASTAAAVTTVQP